MASYKAQALRDELASELLVRLASLAQTKSFGANGEAQLALGSLATDSDSVLIQFAPVATNAKDVLGAAQTVFGPHVANIVLEAGSTGFTWKTRASVIGILLSRGIELNVYERTHGTGVAYTDITSGNLKTTVDLQLQYPGMSGQV